MIHSSIHKPNKNNQFINNNSCNPLFLSVFAFKVGDWTEDDGLKINKKSLIAEKTKKNYRVVVIPDVCIKVNRMLRNSLYTNI